jgi:hypothetical protein
MSPRLLDALDRGPPWARRSLVIAVPLVLLGVLVAGFALAPTEAGDRSEQTGAAARVLPPSPTTATQSTLGRRRPPSGPVKAHQRRWPVLDATLARQKADELSKQGSGAPA